LKLVNPSNKRKYDVVGTGLAESRQRTLAELGYKRNRIVQDSLPGATTFSRRGHNAAKPPE
jgi:hypothetical protein